MRKVMFLLIISLFVSISTFPKDRFTISLIDNILLSFDKNFREIYTNGAFFPELKIEYRTYKNIFIYSAIGFHKKETEIFSIRSKSKHTIFSFGGSYNWETSDKFSYKGGFGFFYILYNGKIQNNKTTDSGFGFRIDLDIIYYISKSFFAKASIGYLCALNEINDINNILITPGGFKLGLGIGVDF